MDNVTGSVLFATLDVNDTAKPADVAAALAAAVRDSFSLMPPPPELLSCGLVNVIVSEVRFAESASVIVANGVIDSGVVTDG